MVCENKISIKRHIKYYDDLIRYVSKKIEDIKQSDHDDDLKISFIDSYLSVLNTFKTQRDMYAMKIGTNFNKK